MEASQKVTNLSRQTIVAIRNMAANLRLGEEVDKIAIEVVLTRALLDIAALLDYTEVLEKNQK
jgi:hypothetical protein